jgi:hypothetical protein
MKVIWRNAVFGDGGNVMFDTNAADIYTQKSGGKYNLCISDGKVLLVDSKDEIQKWFDAIVAAEKRGDAFFTNG